MLPYDYNNVIIILFYYYTNVCNRESLKIARNWFFDQIKPMIVMGKTSPQPKFGHYDAKIALRYAVPLS